MGGPVASEIGSNLLDRLRIELDEPELSFAVPPAPLAGGAFTSVLTFELATTRSDWSGQLVLRLVGSEPMQARIEPPLAHQAVQPAARDAERERGLADVARVLGKRVGNTLGG